MPSPVPTQQPSIPPIPVAHREPVRSPVPARLREVPCLAFAEQSFVATATAARAARRHTAQILSEWNLDDLEFVVNQIVSELVTNAAMRPDATTVWLTVRLLETRISIEVFDNDPEAPVLREIDSESEDGRGLPIVRSLACGLAVVPLASGKLVVALVRRPLTIVPASCIPGPFELQTAESGSRPDGRWRQ